MEWFLKLHQDYVLIHSIEKDGPYCWGSVHIDLFFDAHTKNWYKELVDTGSVYVKFEGEWI